MSLTLNLVVTTSLKYASGAPERAQEYANELGAIYTPRENKTLPQLFEQNTADRCLIVEGKELALAHIDGNVYRYHPNMGFVRSLNILRQQRDLFVDAAELRPGERVLDCTLGFGGEAMMAALLVGETGRVVGLESVPELALMTRVGLGTRQIVKPKLEDAMRRIEVVNADYRSYLAEVKAGEFDVICFDPFFDKALEGSKTTIGPLHRFGNPSPLNCESVVRAISVAGRRVLVKHPREHDLSSDLINLRSRVMGARKRKVVYSVFDTPR